ncbi:hypothetical protein [Paenibacillus segetis]|uniref:hypothetical protein n=1 Tax=Paenibacillus segetis TaxID=1325360 RepID=UPI001888B203|nr:hypothetical protein [Paenibacillus segetis]
MPYGPWSARSISRSVSGGQPCEPNRVAAAPFGLKVLGFVNTTTLGETAEEQILLTKEG